MTTTNDIVRLQEQTKALFAKCSDQKDEIAALKLVVKEMDDRGRKRIWAGLTTLGGITLSLITVIGLGVAYIFKRETGG